VSEQQIDWRESLPEQLRAAPALKDVKDVPGLAQAFVDTKALVGGSIRPPGPDAAPEARKEFIERLQKAAPELVLVPQDDKALAELEDSIFTRFGKPKDAKGYEAPKDVEIPAEQLEALRAEAAAEGLTKRQFAARAKRVAEGLAVAAKASADAQAALKRELGAAYEERLGIAAAAAEKLGFPKALIAAVKGGSVDLDTYKALAAVAKGFGETRQLGDQAGGGSGRLTPSEARLQIAELRARKEYWDSGSNPALHQQLQQRMQELAKAAYPEEG
jgi:hypothetical protein